MALTKDDIKQIREVVIEGFETLAVPRFDALENDVTGLKKDVSELKQDVSVLKQDVSELKHDMRAVKSDIGNLNDKFDTLAGQVTGLERDVREIYLMLAKRDAGAPSFNKLTLEQKIKSTYEQLMITAKEAGVTLPRD